jgi:hypothetical protein
VSSSEFWAGLIISGVRGHRIAMATETETEMMEMVWDGK